MAGFEGSSSRASPRDRDTVTEGSVGGTQGVCVKGLRGATPCVCEGIAWWGHWCECKGTVGGTQEGGVWEVTGGAGCTYTWGGVRPLISVQSWALWLLLLSRVTLPVNPKLLPSLCSAPKELNPCLKGFNIKPGLL
ncbi:unnamed protein product [Eretmochelys imbricata]